MINGDGSFARRHPEGALLLSVDGRDVVVFRPAEGQDFAGLPVREGLVRVVTAGGTLLHVAPSLLRETPNIPSEGEP